ncbi:MAG: hypothetical protein RL258_1335, partial [Pseudomonadota bacterium]
GYDFLLIRHAVGQAPEGLGDWWTRFIDGDDADRSALMESVRGQPGHGTSSRRSRPRRRGRGAQAA